MNFLHDLSHASLPLSYDKELIKIRAKNRPEILFRNLGDDRKVAWVVSNKRDFKLIHQLCVFTRLNHLEIHRQPFREINRAIDWLGLPEDLYSELKLMI
jgi:hypothetical protein